MRFAFFLFAGVLVLSGNLLAESEFEFEWGIIKEGAFVIPSRNLRWTDSEGRAAGKRIGYLRVGSVVKVGECRHVNAHRGLGGQYCDVHSESGVAGKTHDSLIFRMERGKRYAIAMQEVNLFDRVETNRRRDVFSRNAGVIVEIVGNFRNTERHGNVNVVALYNLDRTDALANLSIKKSDLIEKTYVVEFPNEQTEFPVKLIKSYSNGKPDLRGGPIGLWTFRPVNELTKDELLVEISSGLNWNTLSLDEGRKILERAFDLASGPLDRIFCVASIDSEVNTGLQILGNGLGLTATIPIYSRGKLFDIDFDVLERNGVPTYTVMTAKTVRCDMGATPFDSRPRAVESVSVSVTKLHSGSRNSRALESLPNSDITLNTEMAERYGLKEPVAVDSENNAKLFEIEGFLHFSQAYNLVMHRIAQTDLLYTLSRDEREALANMIISKLATFVRASPDIETSLVVNSNVPTS